MNVLPVCEGCVSVCVLAPVCAVLVLVVLGEGEAHLTDRGLGRGHLDIT